MKGQNIILQANISQNGCEGNLVSASGQVYTRRIWVSVEFGGDGDNLQ